MPRPRADAFLVSTTERILDAAEAEFARAGFDAARLEDIARVASIRRPSLLYHFGSKERLYADVVRRAFGALDAALAGAISAGGTFEARLDALTLGFVTFLRARPHVAPLLLREILDGQGPGRDLLELSVAPVLDRVVVFVSAAGAAPDLDIRATVLDLAAAALVRAAAGPLRATLWGPGDPSLALARTLFLPRSPWLSPA